MISIGGYTFGVDDKCALFLRINDWQDDLAKHAPWRLPGQDPQAPKGGAYPRPEAWKAAKNGRYAT
jgi:hypothetical protein